MESFVGAGIVLLIASGAGYFTARYVQNRKMEMLLEAYNELFANHVATVRLNDSLMKERLEDPYRVLADIEKELGQDYLQN